MQNPVELGVSEEAMKNAVDIENSVTTHSDNINTNGAPIYPPVEPRSGTDIQPNAGFITNETAWPTGKMVFTNSDGLSASCTASFINSASKALLITAAHCVHGGKGKGWSSQVMFYPNHGSHGGQQGLPVATMRAFDSWINREIGTELSSADIKDDVAFMSINEAVLPSFLQNPVNQYGGYGLGHSGLTSFDAMIFGYPKDPGNNYTPQSCSTVTRGVNQYEPLLNFFTIIQADCAAPNPHGASGGPWVQLYDSAKKTGWVNGVSSAGEANQTLHSTVFDDRVYSLYTQSVNAGM